MGLPFPDAFPSTLFHRDTDTAADAVHVEESGLEVRIGRDRLDVPRIGHPLGHVMGDDQPPRLDQGEEFFQVVDITGLVGVEEEDVDRLLELFDVFVRVPLDDGDHIGHAGTLEILAGQGEPLFADVERRQLTVGLFQCQTAPDSRAL